MPLRAPDSGSLNEVLLQDASWLQIFDHSVIPKADGLAPVWGSSRVKRVVTGPFLVGAF